jgi:SAM-dependent methyltransferase
MPWAARIQTAADRWLYEHGAALYAWCTAQSGWDASCAHLAAAVSPDARRILDLGCGAGAVLIALAATHPRAASVGVDLSSRMLGQARRRAPYAARGLVRADAAALPWPPGAFDAVTSHSFFYLVPDRDAVLAEAWRVLRPGGRLALMEPWSGPAAPRAVLRHSRDPRFLLSVTLWRAFNRHRGRFDGAHLADLLRRAGFVRLRGRPVLGGLGLLATAEKPGLL